MNEDLSNTDSDGNSDDDPTGSIQLLNDWQTSGHACRPIRSHRAPKIHRPNFVAFGLTTALAFSVVSGSSPAPVSDVSARTVQAAPLYDPTVPPLPIVTAEEERLQRQTRVSRDDERKFVLNNVTVIRRSVNKPAPRWAHPVPSARITSCYGWRNGTTHKGMDFAAPVGTRIRAVGPGTVVQAGWRFSGLGYSVVIKHGNGQMSLYGHASKVLVRTGQRVSAGATVALVGSTGDSTGPHLHLGYARTNSLGDVFNTLTNPAPWLKGKGVRLARC